MLRTTMEKLQILSNTSKQTLVINTCFSVDYDSIRVDLLDSLGNENQTGLSLNFLAKNSIEVQLPKQIKGVFQVRVKDNNHYLVQKIIIQ